MSEGRKYLKRQVQTTGIDVHPSESAILVFYEIDASIFGEDNQEIIRDVTARQRKIIIPALSSASKIPALADQIMAKCKYIKENRRNELEQLLLFLQERNSGKTQAELDKERSAHVDRQMITEDSRDISASLNDIDVYMERLYEDGQGKLMGSKYLLQLARNPANVEELLENEGLMRALARILKEDSKEDIELQTNLLTIFYFISSFSDFQPLLAQYKVGSTCMSIITQEMKKDKIRRADLQRKREKLKAGKISQKDFDKISEKLSDLRFQQDQLLYVTFHLLLNLSEKIDVEMKMVKKDIVESLVKMLDRTNFEFLVLMVKFLKKLSIYKENKDKMSELDVIPKLTTLLAHDNLPLQHEVVRLLKNLSFDPQLRRRMVQVGAVPKLAAMLHAEEAPLPFILNILYHISMDKQHKALFASTEVIPIVLQLMLTCEEDFVDFEPVALAINIAQDDKCAALLSDGKGLSLLLKRALRTHDALLLKLVRTLCTHAFTKEKLLDFIDPLARQIHESEADADMLLELLGILSSLDIPDFDFEKLVEEYELLPLLQHLLTPGVCENDLFLEAVIMVGTILTDPNCAPLVADCGIAAMLIDMLKDKQEDDEIVLQIIFVWNKLLYYKSTREVVLSEPQAVSYLLDLMHDQNTQIRKVCNSALDIVAECDLSWAQEIRKKQFEFHNSSWIEVVLGRTDQAATPDMYAQEYDTYDDYAPYGGVYDPDEELVYNEGDDDNDLFIGAEHGDYDDGGLWDDNEGDLGSYS